jgi:hypothetical protein
MSVSSTPERRHPERKRHTLRLLRQIATLALLAALALWTLPRLLFYLGLLGPSDEERIAQAARAVDAARAYGATPDIPAYAAAQGELERARRARTEGRGSETRRAAAASAEHAVEAQRVALVRAQQTRRKAEEIVDDLDREVNRLEELYSTITPSLDKPTVSGLLSLMKHARETAATLFLAKDQGNYERVVTGEAQARQVLAETRARLEGARRRPPSPGGS